MTEPKEKVACAECGAEVELEGGLLVWAKKNPDKFRCPECQKKKYANKIAEGKASNTKSFAKKKLEDTIENATVVTAKMLRQAYDEVAAEFADVIEDVRPFLGAWATTVVLSQRKKK